MTELESIARMTLDVEGLARLKRALSLLEEVAPLVAQPTTPEANDG